MHFIETSVHLTSSHHDELEQDEDGGKHLWILVVALPRQFLAQEELEHKEEYEKKEAPGRTEQRHLVQSFQLHSNQHNCAEVRIEAVAGKQGRKHNPPGAGAREYILYSQHEQYCEHSEGRQVDPYLKHSQSEPLHQFIQCEEHDTLMCTDELCRVRVSYSPSSSTGSRSSETLQHLQ